MEYKAHLPKLCCYQPRIPDCFGLIDTPRTLDIFSSSIRFIYFFLFFFFYNPPPFGSIYLPQKSTLRCFYNASRTQVVLEATAGFLFQTAVSYPHRIPRPECGYAAGHRQHHHPPGRHGHHKVRVGDLTLLRSILPRLMLRRQQTLGLLSRYAQAHSHHTTSNSDQSWFPTFT